MLSQIESNVSNPKLLLLHVFLVIRNSKHRVIAVIATYVPRVDTKTFQKLVIYAKLVRAIHLTKTIVVLDLLMTRRRIVQVVTWPSTILFLNQVHSIATNVNQEKKPLLGPVLP